MVKRRSDVQEVALSSGTGWAGGTDREGFEVGRRWRQEALGDRWELGFWVTVWREKEREREIIRIGSIRFLVTHMPFFTHINLLEQSFA